MSRHFASFGADWTEGRNAVTSGPPPRCCEDFAPNPNRSGNIRRRRAAAGGERDLRIPHKNYSGRNGTWPGGNQRSPQPDYSWHDPDPVVFDVPRPSVLDVVFYLTLK